MVFFSEIKNRKVFTEDGIYVGKLNDLIFTFTDIAKVTKLLIKSDPLKTVIHVPINDLVTFGDEVIISKQYVDYDLQENELYVGKNLVDKQIIDIEGKKVVRVNDALLQLKQSKSIYIVGVDIGLIAIFRWFGIEGFIIFLTSLFGKKIKPHMLSWKEIQPLELSEGKVVLNTQQEKLENFHPEDLADYLETTNIQNMIKTLDLVDREFASEVIAELNLNYQIAIFEKLDIEKTVKLLQYMDPDEAVDVLLQFSESYRSKVMINLPKEERNELEGLIKLSTTTVGQYLTSEFLYVFRDDKASKVIEKLKMHTPDFDFLFYVYVVNDEKQLIGVFTLHELLLQKPHTPVHKFMHTNIVLAYPNTPIQLVIKRMITYKLYGLPIISNDKKILGIIVLDDIDDLLLEQIS